MSSAKNAVFNQLYNLFGLTSPEAEYIESVIRALDSSRSPRPSPK